MAQFVKLAAVYIRDFRREPRRDRTRPKKKNVSFAKKVLRITKHLVRDTDIETASRPATFGKPALAGQLPSGSLSGRRGPPHRVVNGQARATEFKGGMVTYRRLSLEGSTMQAGVGRGDRCFALTGGDTPSPKVTVRPSKPDIRKPWQHGCGEAVPEKAALLFSPVGLENNQPVVFRVVSP